MGFIVYVHTCGGIANKNLNYTGVLVHFDDRYWVMFPMAKSMFPQFK